MQADWLAGGDGGPEAPGLRSERIFGTGPGTGSKQALRRNKGPEMQETETRITPSTQVDVVIDSWPVSPIREGARQWFEGPSVHFVR